MAKLITLKMHFNKKTIDNCFNCDIIKMQIKGENMRREDEIFEKFKNLFNRLSEIGEVDYKTMTKLGRIFAKHPKILTIQNEKGKNLGIIACEKNLEDIVLLILDNYEASVQLDNTGENIGMRAAALGLERATLKALNNEVASVQQCKDGFNIGMFAAWKGLEKATLKALDNSEASVQQNRYGINIGMAAAQNGLEKATLKALDNEVARRQLNEYRCNIGIFAAYKKLKSATMKALQDPIARSQKNIISETIESVALDNGLEDVVNEFYTGVRHASVEDQVNQIENIVENQ